jgi:uncharacterized protein
VKILRAADRKAVPWKNGGGTTTEVAVYPAGAGFDDFGWRVSIADVRQGGPFSLFPGDNKTEATLTGGAVIDLNVMTRRGAFAASITKRVLTDATNMKTSTTCIALAISSFELGGGHTLELRDAIQTEAGEEFVFPAGASFYWIELTAQNR